MNQIEDILIVAPTVSTASKGFAALVLLSDGTEVDTCGPYSIFKLTPENEGRFGFEHQGWACDAFFFDLRANPAILEKLCKLIWNKTRFQYPSQPQFIV